MRHLWLIVCLLLIGCQPRHPVAGRYEGNLTHSKDRIDFSLEEGADGAIKGRYRLRYYSRTEEDFKGEIVGRREHNQLFLEFKRPGKPSWKGEGYVSVRPFTESDAFQVDRLIGPRRDGTPEIPDTFFDGIVDYQVIELDVIGAENHHFSSRSDTLVPELRKRIRKHFP